MIAKRNFIELVARTWVLAAMLLSANASAQNLLTNPDFETGDLTGWDLVGPEGSQSVGAPGVGAQSGSFAANLNAPTDGVPEISQGGVEVGVASFPASPGQEFNLSGYMLTETALPTGATFGLLKIVFEDEFGTDLEPASASKGQINFAFPGVESLPFLDSTSPVDTWIFTEAQGVAPPGTASVFFLVLNVDFGNDANHPMWFDNISATEVLPGTPGDFDADGDVDGKDFLEWQRGNSTPGGSLSASDLALWQEGFGAFPPAGVASTVPEPSSLVVLLGLGVVTTFASGRRVINIEQRISKDVAKHAQSRCGDWCFRVGA